MIMDRIENARQYQALGEVGRVLEMIRAGKLAGLALGRHDIDGDRVYALAQEYQTRERSNGVWEAHRKYIDVQWVEDGVEAMGWAPAAGLQTRKEYDDANDVTLFDGEGSFIRMPAGTFAVFWPDDAHMPCQTHGPAAVKVKKLVVKVAVE